MAVGWHHPTVEIDQRNSKGRRRKNLNLSRRSAKIDGRERGRKVKVKESGR